MWEPIKGPDAVQTPAEVYSMLAREGLAVRYLRVPVTDGKAPQPCDIDAIVKQVGTAGRQGGRLHVVVFCSVLYSADWVALLCMRGRRNSKLQLS